MQRMNIHHINCPAFLGLMPDRELAANHCLLLETDGGLVLVDTGLGTADVADPGRVGLLRAILRTRGRLEETALFQVRRLGFSEMDVQHILMTHLDGDHAGGISDFPHAKVHVCKDELHAATRRSTFRERIRYSPKHIDPIRQWVAHDRFDATPWYGFACARDLEGLPEEIVLVRLPGHTRGHCGIAVRQEERWLLHAGDAYYHHRQMDARPACPPQPLLLQFFAHKYPDRATLTRRRLRQMANEERATVTMVCTHDVAEFQQMQAR